ncbi:argonaute-like protein [Lentinus tigrinus ALCF2SS1-7]|uniref:argonaute-like protein n=1 Tax=Lentinus tigrinus ALCF2SS1-7 TaxID=1328758 RepID=UPI001165F299|nr:argonaute-like protein [Lentinus tigrinus ALCF2SS1-7]
MPPRAPSGNVPGDRGRGAPRGRGARGGARGGPPSSTPSGRGARGGPPSAGGPPPSFRGAPPGRGRGRGQAGAPSVPSQTTSAIGAAPARPPDAPGITRALPDARAHITTIGVKRTAFGTSGRSLNVYTNHFVTSTPEGSVYHYDVLIDSENKTLPARLNMEIIRRLQTVAAPDVFTPPAVYDGRKNMFAPRQLPLGPDDTREFTFPLTDTPASSQAPAAEGERRRGPKMHKVKLTLVNTINTEVLRRFVAGKQSHDNDVLTAITALNVVIRMQPSLDYPFNVRSFFTNRETKDIGGGIVLWRGYFQSVRPAINRLLINVDITTGFMYKPGSIIDLALDFLSRQRDPNMLAPTRGFPERERLRLQRFLSGVRIHVQIPGQAPAGPTSRNPRPVAKLTPAGANQLSFTNREGRTVTVAQYFRTVHNYTLRFPDIVCVQLGSGAQIPMECCVVPEGQFMRKQVPPDKVTDVLSFAAKSPPERLNSIREGLRTLAYGQSEYVREFGMQVEETAGPMTVQARVLAAPTLRYSSESKQPTIQPRDGEWNLIDKKFYQPATINRWVVVIYERQQRFRPEMAREMVSGFVPMFRATGMQIRETDPIISYQHSAGRIADQLREVGRQCFEKNGKQGGPELIVVVLPDNSADMYHAVKHFGDITQGVATQCLSSMKCSRARPQYYANVCLKINVKMGGINAVPEARSVPALTDPHNPTIVMGADVIHPAPGTQGRPSFTSLVGSVDSDTSKYVAECRVQTGRVEMIQDLQNMAEGVLNLYKSYRTGKERKPFNLKRIIFYRDGVSEGEFRKVIEQELPQLKAACVTLGIQPKITMLVVGKRHHVRFFPRNTQEADPSGNCPAGTIVDSDITHPTEFDFYLQSHSGLKRGRQAPAGPTSRSAHYNVLYDENNFTPDSLQALSYALCHVYARATRSVSIPAPVYYADIVCARAKLHYVPGGQDLSESGATQLSTTEADRQMETFRTGFKPVHEHTRYLMYFS